MIHKMSSQDFNNILQKTQDNILNMNNEISNIKNDMKIKLDVINHEIEYLNTSLNTLQHLESQDVNYILLNENLHGLFECYSNNIHAALKKEPVNIFNVKPINSEDYFYKDEAKVSINGIENDHYKNILKADSIKNKKIFFEEYATTKSIEEDTNGSCYLSKDNKIIISIYIDKQKVYELNKFNMIEIDPFLMKSFDINSVKIYDSNNVIVKEIVNINQTNKTRLLLDKKYIFNKIELTITPKYTTTKNNETIIPFGLKHIYFYNVDFRNDSYIEVTYESEEYIDHILNKIDIYTPTGIISTTLKEQGIKIYLDNINGNLSTEQEPTENIRKTISRNLKKIYFKVPLAQNENTVSFTNTMFAFKFFIKNR